MRLKRGKLEGVLWPHKYGSTWLIKADSITNSRDLELTTLNLLTPSPVIRSQENDSQLLTVPENALLREKDEHLTTLKNQLTVYEKLLTDFQSRIHVLESEKSELSGKIKLLPAPIESVASRLQELESVVREKEEVIKAELDYREQLSHALHEQESRIMEKETMAKNLQAKLDAERKRPWWKKLFKQ